MNLGQRLVHRMRTSKWLRLLCIPIIAQVKERKLISRQVEKSAGQPQAARYQTPSNSRNT